MPIRKLQPPPIANRLLAALSKKEYAYLAPHLEQVALPFAEVLYNPGDAIRHVYFPDTGIVSLLSTVKDRATIEVGIVGNEGMVGISVFLGVTVSNNRMIVQSEGTAMRLETRRLETILKQSDALHGLLHRYTHALLTQISQSAACNRFHPVEARLARWLMMTRDRVGADDFRITQEFMSNMLGVRREAVAHNAAIFQKKRLIAYSRGHITILNRAGLEKAACNCYRIVKDEYDGFLPHK